MADPRGRTKPATRADPKKPGNGTIHIPRHQKVNLLRALALRAKGISQTDIARMMGCHRSSISQAFAKFGDIALTDNEETAVDDLRTKLWKGAEFKLLRTAMDDSKLKKAPLAALMMGAGISFDKVRILEGKSTANVFHGVMVSLQKDALESGIKLAKSGESARNEGERGDIEPAEVPEDAKLVSNTVPASETDEESGS